LTIAPLPAARHHSTAAEECRMTGRDIDVGRITSERAILQKCLDEGKNLETSIDEVKGRSYRKNEVRQAKLGVYRPPTARKAVIADMELIGEFQKRRLKVPSFMEAGPRARLLFNPHGVRAAIVTTGGLAPGLNCVIHAIVKRHCNTYGPCTGIFGVYNSFKGLCNLADNRVSLDPDTTEEWLDKGGSQLGSVRYHYDEDEQRGKRKKVKISEMASRIVTNLRNNNIDILYVIGGDGSLRVAHEIAQEDPTRSIVGIPKTMDNDILWVWQSFGFDTAVEQAKQTINTLRSEAEGTRRICLIELFGAESGFVAANAALASGHTDAVLIPEVFKAMSGPRISKRAFAKSSLGYLDELVDHIQTIVQNEPKNPHAVVVIAEGVGAMLEANGVAIGGIPVKKKEFLRQFEDLVKNRVKDAHGNTMAPFTNRPQHYVRAVPANSHDQIYCERLGALAVDNALAGYTSFVISQWLTEYVLVPTSLVIKGQKSIPVNGMFWKQVVSGTGQPLSKAEVPPEPEPQQTRRTSRSRKAEGTRPGRAARGKRGGRPKKKVARKSRRR